MVLPSHTVSCLPHQYRMGRTLCILSVVILVVLSTPSASAQCSTGVYGNNYSDTWIVGVNQPTRTTNANGETEIYLNGTPSANVYGYGSYDEPYNSCGHEGTIDVSMTSPNGRVASASGGGRADVWLPLLEDDLGDYFTSHATVVFCPIASRFFDGGGAISSRTIGVSFSVYQKVLDRGPNSAVYQVIQPCNTTCIQGGGTGNFVFLGPPLPPFFVIGTPFFRAGGFRICETAIRSFYESAFRVECGDLGIF